MLSIRSALLVCFLLLAPLAQADAFGLAEDVETNAQETPELTVEPKPAGQEPPVSVPEELVITTLEDAYDTATAAADDAVTIALDKVDYALGVADGAVSTVQETGDDAQRRLPSLDEEVPQEDTSEEAYEYAPQATAIEAVELENFALMGATAAVAGLLFWLAGSTGQVGSQAVASTAELRRLMPYASPMFTRFERDTVLGHPKREALYANIIGTPGITLQDLCEKTGLSRTAVSHHLRLLEQQHLIVSKRMGRSCHFFENGGRYGRDQKEAYAVLHNARSKDVHDYIQANPGAIQKDLCGALDIQASVAHWHVKRLEEASLIETMRQGRTVSYFARTA